MLQKNKMWHMSRVMNEVEIGNILLHYYLFYQLQARFNDFYVLNVFKCGPLMYFKDCTRLECYQWSLNTHGVNGVFFLEQENHLTQNKVVPLLSCIWDMYPKCRLLKFVGILIGSSALWLLQLIWGKLWDFGYKLDQWYL